MNTNTLKDVEKQMSKVLSELISYNNEIQDLKIQYERLIEEKYKVMRGIEVGNVIKFRNKICVYLGVSYEDKLPLKSIMIILRCINKNGELSKREKQAYFIFKDDEIVKLCNSYEEYLKDNF